MVPAAASIGCEVRADTAAGFDLVRERARAAVEGSAAAYGVDAAMSASDDVTVPMDAVQRRGGQATLMLVGASSPAPHHHEPFDIDERALGIAADWLEGLVRRTACG